MFDRIVLLDGRTSLGVVLTESLAAEGYEVVRTSSVSEMEQHLGTQEMHLIVVNGMAHELSRVVNTAASDWDVPLIVFAEEDPLTERMATEWQWLSVPFAFQDLLFLVQNALHQRTLSGHRPFELHPALIDEIEAILKSLRKDVRARCVVLSSSSGRLIKTVGGIDRSMAISLAALMSGSFSASAKAAQLLGQGDVFDSNLQESEGYGLYAILLHDRLILTVAFSAKITIGMVRHYAAQAAVDILEVLMQETGPDDLVAELDVDPDFRETVAAALGDLLGG